MNTLPEPSRSHRIEAVYLPGTLLRGRWLAAARIAWLAIMTLTVVVFILAIPSDYRFQLQEASGAFKPALQQIGRSPEFFAGFRLAQDIAIMLLFTLVGIFIFWRKSDDWLVMLVSIGFSTFATLYVPTTIRLMQYTPGFTPLVGFIRAIGLGSILTVFYYLFPDGRFVPGWLKWVNLVWLFSVLMWCLFPTIPANLVYLENWFNNLPLSFPLYVLWFATGVGAQIYRYRRVSNSMQRQQTKWVVFGTTGAMLGFFLYYLPLALIPELRQPGVARLLQILIGEPILDLFVLLAPLTIAISILRFRLWDVDFFINRSLVYVVLSASLLVVYFGLVLLLQAIFKVLIGEQLTEFVSVVSTLVIALLFSPLRVRIQEVIDRRFYRHKYDTARTLAAFGLAVREEVDLDQLQEKLLLMIRDTVHPARMSLWLNTPLSQDEELLVDIENHPALKAAGLSRSDLVNNNLGRRE